MKYFSIRPLPDGISRHSPVTWLVLWGHSGRLRPASGTWGSLAALPFALFIQYYAGWPLLGLFAVTCFILGLWAIPRYTAVSQQKDPSEIVLDEVVGIALTFLPLVRFDIGTILLGFLAFRLFDATKPGPIGWCDKRVPGALGVMLDDVVAGVLAAVCVYLYQRYVAS